jgi:hypothetical protein
MASASNQFHGLELSSQMKNQFDYSRLKKNACSFAFTGTSQDRNFNFSKVKTTQDSLNLRGSREMLTDKAQSDQLNGNFFLNMGLHRDSHLDN